MLSSEGLLKVLTGRAPRLMLLAVTVIVVAPAVWSRNAERRESALDVLRLLLFGLPQPSPGRYVEQGHRPGSRIYTRPMTTDRLVDTLLFWAMDESGGDITCHLGPSIHISPSRLPVPDEAAVQDAIHGLVSRGWAHVGPRGRNASGEIVFYTLTSAGVQEADRRRRAIGSRRDRLVYAENAILTWVFETAEPGRPVELIDFIDSDVNSFYGSQLTAAEVTAASNNLVGLKMLSTTSGSLTGVWLQAEGIACAMSDQPVRKYIERKSQHFEQHIHPGAAGAQGIEVSQRVVEGKSEGS
ncbi:hypothetical protein [Streptomyces goshikiensis]|uniref:hypothetical protein n=1 Tax=Streptomyces goshikiensis TaxID=1942 RepID=UPI00364BC78F